MSVSGSSVRLFGCEMEPMLDAARVSLWPTAGLLGCHRGREACLISASCHTSAVLWLIGAIQVDSGAVWGCEHGGAGHRCAAFPSYYANRIHSSFLKS